MNRLASPIQLDIRQAAKNALAAVLCAVLAFGPASQPVLAAKSESAKSLFAKGQSAEAREDYDAAYSYFQRAYAKKPTDLRYRASFYRTRTTASTLHVTRGRKLLQQGEETNALSEFMHASEIDPGNEAAIQQISGIRAHMTPPPPRAETSISGTAANVIEDAAGPVQLKPVSNEPLTLHMEQDSKVIYQAIGRAAGINVLFDPQYNGKRIQLDLNNMSLLDALRIVGTLSTTFWRPITENTIFVAENNRAKRTEFDEQAVQTFYLANAWQQNDLNDVQTALRQVVPNSKVYGIPSQNALVMRGTPDELMLAQKVINDLDKARPEVVVDIAVMEVNKDKLRNIGLSWPGSISFALQPPQSSTTTSTTTTDNTTSTTALTLNNLANLNATNFAITVSSATANLLMSDSDTKILQNPRIRATDQQKASMKIGSRIPVATGSYQTGVSTAITSSLVNTQFNYIDVGVQIDMTPTVHFDHDVTLKMKIEVSSESGTSTISGVTEPIISQRTVEQVIRLREGEANILGGILQKSDLVSASGIPGLGELPLLRYIFGSRSHEVVDDEIVFVLIPHVVREQSLSPLNLRTIDTGPGQTIELRRISDPAPGAGRSSLVNGVSGATGQPRLRPFGAASAPPAAGQPGGPVQGQTATAAAPNALAQLRQSADPDAANPDAASGRAPITVPGAPPVAAAAAANPAAVSPVNFVLTTPATAPIPGATFPVTVTLNGAQNVASVPMQITYDASKLSLVNVDGGDMLGKDGQAVALVHRDDGPGLITIAASRPPGSAGVSGSGSVCVLTFQAKQSGESDIVVSRPGAMDSANHPIPATAQNAHISVK